MSTAVPSATGTHFPIAGQEDFKCVCVCVCACDEKRIDQTRSVSPISDEHRTS
jgi:hypothetical protein